MAGSKISSYRDLIMWQKSRDFAVQIYKATDNFPKSELYGLTNQLRRASVSIPSNIAEGFRRRSPKEKTQFLRMAYGSGAELETQLDIAKDLKYLDEATYHRLVSKLDEVMKIINVVFNKI